jgi:hypothetical protein
MAVYILKFVKGLRCKGAKELKQYPSPIAPYSPSPLNQKAQVNFGFIIAVLLLIVVIITATTGVLDKLPSIKHDAETSAMAPRIEVISKLLLEDPGYPATWTSANVERVGLIHHNSYNNKTKFGQLNSTKINYVATLSHDTIAHQLGLFNDTNFRLRVSNANMILDINQSLPGSTASVFVLNRVFSLDGTSFVNATLEVWE